MKGDNMFDGDYESEEVLTLREELGKAHAELAKFKANFVPMELKVKELEQKLRESEADNKQLQADCDHYRSLVPTTAHAMAYEDLLRKYQESEAGAAVMRTALKAWRDYFQSEKPKEEPDWQSGEDFTKAWFQAQEALSTDAGKSTLATLTEAHWLLEHCQWQRSEVNREWFGRCEALLKKWKGGYV